MRKNQFEYLSPSYMRMERLALKEQFFIYEFDRMLNILQKVKIPKHIFRNFVEQSDRWEFESFMPFRLRYEDIIYFEKHCGFRPFNLEEHCIDVFVDIQDYSLIDISQKKLTKVSREFFQSSCKNVFREYPDFLDPYSLRILAKILNKPIPQNAFFTEKNLSLQITQDEDSFLFHLKHTNLYNKLFRHKFQYFFKPSFDDTMLFLQENGIDFALSKEAKSMVGYSIAYTERNIQVVLQYDEFFEICHPSKKQQANLERLFYKPLPNMNFFLGAYGLGGGRCIVPNLYFNLYGDEEEDEYYRLKFDLELVSINTLKKMFFLPKGFRVDFCTKISNQDRRRIQKKFNLNLGANEYYLDLLF